MSNKMVSGMTLILLSIGLSMLASNIVHSAAPGDLNDDGKVDIRDVAVAAVAFGSHPGHLRWNPIADVNKDNTVNIVDIVLIAKNVK